MNAPRSNRTYPTPAAITEMMKTLCLHIVLLIAPLSLLAQHSGTIRVARPDINAQRITASSGGVSGGPVHKGILLEAATIEVNDTIRVIVYEINMTRDSVTKHLTVEGDKIAQDIKNYIRGLSPGQIVNFRNILCQDANRLRLRVTDLQFEIVVASKDQGSPIQFH